MLSVVIATHDSEKILVPTLAALVPGVAAGAVREVILADAGSRDQTAEIGDIAGCSVMTLPGPLSARLRNAAAAARGDWLMFLRPGTVPDFAWIGEALAFVQGLAAHGPERAAVFRTAPVSPAHPLAEAMIMLKAALVRRAHPDQGLIVRKRFYDAIGGHSDTASDTEADLLRRLGRRRIVMLRSGVSRAV